jgi:two-component system invasion response regulator UvrY
MPTNKIRILVVDDHPVVRDGLREVFRRTPRIIIEGEAETGQKALDFLRNGNVDVMLLDISMPGMSWLDVLKNALAIRPRLAVLILSMYKDEDFIVRSLQAGAAGYLTKDSIGNELVQAVEKAASGRRYISSSVAETLAEHINRGNIRAAHQGLSDREFQVMIMLARGLKPSEIARDLFLSVNTVNTYKSRILEKMKAKNVADLVRYAVKADLLD